MEGTSRWKGCHAGRDVTPVKPDAMAQEVHGPVQTFSRLRLGSVPRWLRDHDPELAATRRAGRTAIVMPALFALCGQVIGSPTMATFAAFGSFSMLLFVDFAGPMVQRLRAHLGLAVAWAALICLGTAVADETWLAVALMVVVGFLVLFAGVVSSVLAGASTALLLAFILPVTSPAPFSELPDRLAGAGLAAVASMLAIALMWPRPAADPLSAPAAQVCRAAARQLRTDASLLAGGPGAPSTGQCRATADEACAAAANLRTVFDATPYRPTGLSTSSRATVRLVDELTWLSGILADSAPSPDGHPECDADARFVRRAAAALLDEVAALLDAPDGSPDGLHSASEKLRTVMAAMERNATARLPVHRGGAARRRGCTRSSVPSTCRSGRRSWGSRPFRSPTTWTWPRRPNAGAGSNVCSVASPVRGPRRWPRRVSGQPRTFNRSPCGCTTACAERSASGSRWPSRT